MQENATTNNNEKRHFYVNYDVIDHSSRNPKDLGEYSLIVYTNYPSAYEYMFNYLSESIYVDYELKIRSDEFVRALVANDARWSEFYKRTAQATPGKFIVYRVDSKKKKKHHHRRSSSSHHHHHRHMRWYFKLTGFKSSCEHFLQELVAHFGNVFE